MTPSRMAREDILRHLWTHRYFHSELTHTTDGKVIRVISPGILNRGTGPDFNNALIELDGTLFRGDVEFHLTWKDWNAHRHTNNPKYNSVILHVILYSASQIDVTRLRSGREVPVLVLEPLLFHPLTDILEQVSREEFAARSLPGTCNVGKVDAGAILDRIDHLFIERMTEKMERLRIRLVQILEEKKRASEQLDQLYHDHCAGTVSQETLIAYCAEVNFSDRHAWEQLLYEGVMDGLGYSNNRAPMKALAFHATIDFFRTLSAKTAISALHIESLLFHYSGFLSQVDDVDDQASKIRIHQLQAFCAGNDGMTAPILSSTDWIFAPTRPSNFPTIRLAAASFLIKRIIDEDLFSRILVALMTNGLSEKSRSGKLHSLFYVSEDPFWSYHYSFSESSQRSHAILGVSRIRDILINTVIPVFLLYARVFSNIELWERSTSAARQLPLLEENGITRRVKTRVIRNCVAIQKAYQQQGLIQLYKNYCSKNRCVECAFIAQKETHQQL